LKNKLHDFFNNSYTELASRCFLAVIFPHATVHEIMHPADFAKIIYGYKIMPGFAINIIAIVLPLQLLKKLKP